MNDDQPHNGTPGIAGGPPAPPRVRQIRYWGPLTIQITMALVVVAIALVMSRMW